MNSYIIHLSRIPASFDSAKVLQAQLAAFGITATLWEGTYGNEAIKQYREQGRQCHPWSFKGPNRPLAEQQQQDMMQPGLIGCFDSHYRLWQLCVELGEPIMIFEDDTRVIREFHTVEWQDVLVVASSHGKKMGRYMHYLESPEGKPRAESYGQSSMPGAAGYVIKPHAAKILVDQYANSFLPADNAINQHLVSILIHSHMMGQAQDREPTHGKSSLIRTRLWDTM